MISFLLLTLGYVCSFLLIHLGGGLSCQFEIFLLIWGRPVLLWTSLWALLLQHPIGFEWLCLHYHLSQGIFLIFFSISSLTHWFFSIVPFSLHVVGFFSFLFMWLISSFMPLWSEKIPEIICTLLNLFRLVLCPSMWSTLRMFHLHLRRMYILIFWDVMSWKCWLNLTFLVCPFGSLLPYWFSVYRICPLTWVGY